MSVRYLCLIAIAATLGCATSPTSSAPGARRNTNVITEQEIASVNVSTAYQVVEKLRPNFLHSRGQTTFGGGPGLPNVYVGTQRYGDISSLRNIATTQVREIRFFSAAEAGTRFGTQNANGVIEVTLR